MSLIFEGKELFAHFNQGDSSYLLITFSSAGHIDDAHRWYLMKDVAERNAISCIGITSSERNFFISEEILMIEKATRNIRSKYNKIVLVGPSMGGYAAIKYSKLFNATNVMSFSPQYSMDPGELEITEDQYVYLRTGMIAYKIVKKEYHRTMAPKPDEVQGNIVIVYDTKEIIDEYAAKIYSRKLTHVSLIGIRHLGHLAIDMYDNDVLFTSMMRVLLSEDRDAMKIFMIQRIKENPRYIVNILSEAARLKPQMCVRALRSKNRRIFLARSEIERNHIENIIIPRAFREKNFDLCYGLLKEFSQKILCKQSSDADWSNARGDPGYTSFLLFSELSTFLCFDLSKKQAVFLPSIDGRPYCRPVLVKVEDSVLCFSYTAGQGIQDPVISGFAGATYRAVPYADSIAVEVHQPDNDSPRYLRTYPNGRLELVRSADGSYETFTLVGVPESVLNAGLTAGDWFERAVFRHAVADIATVNPPRRSPIARLFRRNAAGEKVRPLPTRSQ